MYKQHCGPGGRFYRGRSAASVGSHRPNQIKAALPSSKCHDDRDPVSEDRRVVEAMRQLLRDCLLRSLLPQLAPPVDCSNTRGAELQRSPSRVVIRFMAWASMATFTLVFATTARHAP